MARSKKHNSQPMLTAGDVTPVEVTPMGPTINVGDEVALSDGSRGIVADGGDADLTAPEMTMGYQPTSAPTAQPVATEIGSLAHLVGGLMQEPLPRRDLHGTFGHAKRPPIVCLCGSTRFMEAFHAAGWELTLGGAIVLSVGVCKHVAPGEGHGAEALGPDVAAKLDVLHYRKIDLADFILVLNVGGYMGESTRREVEYARSVNKPVVYLEGER